MSDDDALVYRSFSRAALDAQYDTSKQLAGGDTGPYLERFVAESERARAQAVYETLRYGPHEREVLDYFPSSRDDAPLFVWVHGGYWRRLSKDASSFVAPPLVAAGVSVAVLNYPLAPGASLDDIVASVRAGFVAARRRAQAASGDEVRVVVGGHSVGAQLAGMIAIAYPVHGIFALSGLYDVEPLRHSHINEWIAMDAAGAERNSPSNHRPLGTPPLVIATGGNEQAEFHRQQYEFVRAFEAWGCDVREVPAREYDHFSIALELANAASPLSRALLALIEPAAP